MLQNLRRKVAEKAKKPFMQLLGPGNNVRNAGKSVLAHSGPMLTKANARVQSRADLPKTGGLKSRAGKALKDMTDQEFEKFASSFDNDRYWELQAERGVYKSREEEYTDEEFYDEEEY